jgi:signal peptidase I
MSKLDFQTNIRLFPFKGGSMHPSLKAGDHLVVVPLEDEMPRLGDIVLRRRYETRVEAHRVVGVDGKRERVRTRGDNRPFPDGWWPLGESIGRVAAVRRTGVLMPPPPAPSKWRRRFGAAKRLIFRGAVFVFRRLKALPGI